MIDPDRGIGEDHYSLRRGDGSRSGWVPPRLARRLALSRSTNAFRASLRSGPRSLSPVRATARSSRSSSKDTVVRMGLSACYCASYDAPVSASKPRRTRKARSSYKLPQASIPSFRNACNRHSATPEALCERGKCHEFRHLRLPLTHFGGLGSFELSSGRWTLAAALRDEQSVQLTPFDAISFPLSALWPEATAG